MVLPAFASAGPHWHSPVEFYLSASAVELWCQGNTELNIRAISQDQSRKRNRLTNHPALHWRKETILIYSYHQTSYMQWDRSTLWSTCHKVSCHCHVAVLPWSSAHTHQSARDRDKTEKNARYPKKPGNGSSLWVLSLGQVIVRLFCISNTLW